MIKKNYKDIGFVYKGTQVIDKIYKGTDLVFEQGYTREQTGMPPLITTYKTIGKDLKDYKIYGNSIQNGTPTPITPIEIESVGDKTINIWDEQWELGRFNTTTGADVANSTQIRAKNLIPVIPNTDYYIKTPSSVWVIPFDSNKQVLENAYMSSTHSGNSSAIEVNTIITIPSNTYYIRFYCLTPYGTTYNNDICINISDASINGIYEPYGYKMPIITRGKNYFDLNTLYSDTSKFAINDGVLSGTAGNIATIKMYMPPQLLNKTVTISAYFKTITTTNLRVLVNVNGSNKNGNYVNSTETFEKSSYTFTPVSTDDYVSLTFSSGSSGTIYVKDVQLEIANQSTIFEPYVQPTTTNIYLDEPLRKIGDYVDYIDFNNKKVIRNIGKEVLDGSENWSLPSTILEGYSSYRISHFFPTAPVNQILSSHFECFPKSIYTTKPIQNKLTSYAQTDQILIVISNSIADSNNQTSTTNFTTWLSNNNVDVYFSQDAVEETITLPDISTVKGTTVFELDTDINASNMYIKYKSK